MTYPPERMENTWKNFRLFFEKFPTAAAPPLCEQSQPGNDESSIDRFFFENFFFRPPPPLCQQSQPGHDKIIDQSFHRFYSSSTLSRTHKSLLERTTPSIRYRSPVMWSFNSPVLCQTESWRVKPSEPVKKLRTFFAISEVPCPSLYIVNDVSSRADGKYLEKFSTFFEKFFFFSTNRRRCANRISTATTNHRSVHRIYTLDFKRMQVTTRARPHRQDTGVPVCTHLPRQRVTRPGQVKTGHLFENKFSYGHSPSLMRSLSDGERASQTVRAGEKT